MPDTPNDIQDKIDYVLSNPIKVQPSNDGRLFINFRENVSFMKKKLSPLEEKINQRVKIVSDQEEMEKPLRDEIENALANLSTSEEKISYLRKREKEYLRSLPAHTLISSGVVSYEMPGMKLFLDRFISNRIELEKDYVGNKNQLTNFTDPFSLLEPAILLQFEKVERAATKGTEKFDTDIRCAAFVELLYNKKYILNTKFRQKRMIEFALLRYGRNIKISLSTKNKSARLNHQTKKVKEAIPLKTCF